MLIMVLSGLGTLPDFPTSYDLYYFSGREGKVLRVKIIVCASYFSYTDIPSDEVQWLYTQLVKTTWA